MSGVDSFSGGILFGVQTISFGSFACMAHAQCSSGAEVQGLAAIFGLWIRLAQPIVNVECLGVIPFLIIRATDAEQGWGNVRVLRVILDERLPVIACLSKRAVAHVHVGATHVLGGGQLRKIVVARFANSITFANRSKTLVASRLCVAEYE